MSKSTKLARAQQAAAVARRKVADLTSPVAAGKDAAIGNFGAFSAGAIDRIAEKKMPGLSVKPSPIIGVAGVILGGVAGSAAAVTFAGGFLAPLSAELGAMAADSLFGE